jgi:geranylgeranyl diphosphate synthase type II
VQPNSTTGTAQDYLHQVSQLVSEALTTILPAEWDVPGPLRDSMGYSVLAGGKRLRPAFVIAAAEALGANRKDAVPAACAIELIHTYSLIHDDLPAMDNDDLRRGKPTNHKVFGEAMAVLAGDALLTHAFYLLARLPKLALGVSHATALAIVEELSFYAGARGMVGGQAADMLGEQGITDLKQLEYIHKHKTGDLIACSLRAGGHVAGGTEGQLNALGVFGQAIGLAFQIQDDILDVSGDATKLGKPKNSDIDQQKVTYPYLIGLEESRLLVKELTVKAKASITNGTVPHPERLLQLADFLMSRDT